MAEISLDQFTGQGITFPIQLDERGAAVIESNVDIVRKSILSIIHWPLSTRFFLYNYGSRIEELLNEPNDQVLQSLLHHFVVEAVTRWEKRVENIETRIESDGEGKMSVLLKYRIVGTQREDSFIFPFYNELKY